MVYIQYYRYFLFDFNTLMLNIIKNVKKNIKIIFFTIWLLPPPGFEPTSTDTEYILLTNGTTMNTAL